MQFVPFNAKGFQFFARSDLAVVGYNSENADMSNPRGEIIGEIWYIVAEAPNGRRWRHNRSSEYRVAMERHAELMADFSKGFLNALNWIEIDPCYGSEAYESQGIEALRAMEDMFGE